MRASGRRGVALHAVAALGILVVLLGCATPVEPGLTDKTTGFPTTTDGTALIGLTLSNT
ncbi:MAG: hypothetical protein OEW27_16260 [Aquincola sp.]|nr:hypothetical protein [Aquincola sp.]MDH5331495.1 hypothetical protein [Aquincola sp.]